LIDDADCRSFRRKLKDKLIEIIAENLQVVILSDRCGVALGELKLKLIFHTGFRNTKSSRQRIEWLIPERETAQTTRRLLITYPQKGLSPTPEKDSFI